MKRAVLAAALVCALLAARETRPARADAPDPSPLSVLYELHRASGPAYQETDGTWVVVPESRIEWEVAWHVTNRSDKALSGIRLRNHYSSELDVVPGTFNGTHGHVSFGPVGGPHSATAVEWLVGDLAPGATAVLTFHVATGRNPAGKQMYGDEGEYCLDSALTVWWGSGRQGREHDGSMSFSCVRVISRRPPWIRVEVSNTRKDWRLRRPGEYASMAFELGVASNGSVAVLFEGFDDLHRPSSGACAPGPTLPAWYARGSTLEQAEAAGWVQADEFNRRWVWLEASPTLRKGRTLTFWQRLAVSEGTPSCEYEDRATVVFILSRFGGMGVAADTTGSDALMPRPDDLVLPPAAQEGL
ncbi:hypothetical protein [Geochorda subterranea]|uniref:Uncharacterized protein n=1 Tax=Geochorda subterranea TaxID=3109564 RepID=A0ABZ1BM20_9FIRM|nr:hypothetical protein [Limnochorda sp. LNt]WRP13854.1 hypothetical protein VLY81_10460 [Limnochorda sp. LNt]